MNKPRVRLFSLFALLLSLASVICFAGFTSTAQQTSKPNLFAGDRALKELAHYRHWTRVNEKPLEISSITVPVSIPSLEGIAFPAV